MDDLPVVDGTAEVVAAVRGLKNGKAARKDEITQEMLKKGSQDLTDTLINLVNECWTNATVPEDWRRGMIIRLPKKGNLSDCNNWRGITLLSVPGKVLCAVAFEEDDHASNRSLFYE